MKQLLTAQPTRVQLGAGVLVTGIRPEQLRSETVLRAALAEALTSGEGVLGLTGTGSFQCVPRLISPEGSDRTPNAAELVCGGWRVCLQGVAREFTPGSLRLLLNAPSAEGTVCSPGVPRALPLLCWVGDTTDGLTVIALREAVNTAGMQLTLRETGAGSLAFCFETFAADPEDEAAPCLLFFPEERT